jgi:hypothetical protein
LGGGFIVGNATRSSVAAMLFQVGPFAHFDTFHFEMVLTPESLMTSSAVLAMALVVKAALEPEPPTERLGVVSGLVFAFGFSSKYLFFPMAFLSVSLLRNKRALAGAFVAGTIAFTCFNFAFNPGAINRGFGWLFSIATHKGAYGQGEPGFIDFKIFWSNMVDIIAAAPIIFAIYIVAALVGLVTATRGHSDPVGRTLLAAFAVFAVQLVLTSKHFALHYMMTSWVIIGGVLVLTIVQIRRVVPAMPVGVVAGAAAAACAMLVLTTLNEVRRDASETARLDRAGARLSKAVIETGPTCANVSSMFVHAPENELNHGADMTIAAWGDQEMKDRLADSYTHAFAVPLLDHNFQALSKNFQPYTYEKLALEHPCIVVRTAKSLDLTNSHGLLDLNPEHCIVAGVQVYSLGIPCAKIGNAYASIVENGN